jgi:outer membrane immunogenic protein
MKNFVFAIAAITGLLSGPVMAADMPVKAPPLPAPVVSNWTGFYLGVNAGGDWGTSDPSTAVTSGGSFFVSPPCFPPLDTCIVNTPDVANASAGQKDRTKGFTGGFQGGYNWQSGNAVYGIETDLEYFRSSGSSSKTVGLISGFPASVTVGNSMSTDWLYTLRPRVGLVVGNTSLLYVTGGLAVSNLKPSWTFAETAFGNVAGTSYSQVEAGWTVGGGVETMLPGRWTLGLEYLFVDFNNVSQTFPTLLPLGGGGAGATPQNFTHSADLEANIVRVKLNKQF